MIDVARRSAEPMPPTIANDDARRRAAHRPRPRRDRMPRPRTGTSGPGDHVGCRWPAATPISVRRSAASITKMRKINRMPAAIEKLPNVVNIDMKARPASSAHRPDRRASTVVPRGRVASQRRREAADDRVRVTDSARLTAPVRDRGSGRPCPAAPIAALRGVQRQQDGRTSRCRCRGASTTSATTRRGGRVPRRARRSCRRAGRRARRPAARLT